MSIAQNINQAISFQKQNKFIEAKQIYENILLDNKNNPDALHLLGLVESELKNYSQAISFVKSAIQIRPEQAEYYNSLGHIYSLQSNFEQAIQTFNQAIAINKLFSQPYFNLGRIYEQTYDYINAIKQYKLAIEIQPGNLDALNNLGGIYLKQNDYFQARTIFKSIINLEPGYYKAHNNLGELEIQQNNYELAQKNCEKALEIYNNCIEAKINLSYMLRLNGKFSQAINYYKEIISNSHATAWHINKAKIELALCYVNICAWDDYQAIVPGLIKILNNNITTKNDYLIPPIDAVTLKLGNEIYKKITEKYNNCSLQKTKLSASPLAAYNIQQNNKLNIAYLSPDFCLHPVGMFLSHLLPFHNHDKFNIFTFSLRNSSSHIQNKIKQHSSFIDCSQASDDHIISLIKKNNIDLLIDLCGYTRMSRPNILKNKPAPILASWLGYGASLWIKEVDYYITTYKHVPKTMQDLFSEKILYIPESLVACDPKSQELIIPKKIPQKSDYNLPENHIIYCNFNQPYRINKKIFNLWMKILHKVPNSIIWLSNIDDQSFKNNLINFAKSSDINPSRLTFKNYKLLNQDWHLCLADIYLDTLYESGFTTSIFSMCAGLPVITLPGNNPESRTGATVLEAMGLTELIASTEDNYINLAVDMGNDPKKLNNIKNKILINKKTSLLFDPNRFINNLENAFTTMLDKNLD